MFIVKFNGKVKFVEKPDDSMSFLTIDEAVDDMVNNRISKEDRVDITTGSYDNTFFHLNMGMWIRNAYGLWLDENPLTEPSKPEHIINGVDHNPKHPDAISAIIITKVLERLVNETDADGNYDRAMKVVE